MNLGGVIMPNSKPAQPPPPIIVTKFGFNEGLNFGCGFFVAGAIFTTIIVPIITFLLFALAGGVIDALLSAY
jgi:hypothetical protein